MKFSRILVLSACSFALLSSVEAATLTITTTGPNAGAVGVVPTGQVCDPVGGGTCIFTIASGTALRLAANSPIMAPGIFSVGTGDAAGCQPTSTCSFTINSDSSITATFNAGTYPSITIGLAGDGKGEVGADNNRCQNFELGFSACTLYYGAGSEVRVDGRSLPGNLFVNFSGGTQDASGCAATPCVFTLLTDSSLTANFAALTSLAVTPDAPTISVGETQSFTATGTFSNSATRSLSAGPGTWRTRAPMSDRRFSLAAGVVNQRLYAVGGVTDPCLSGPCAGPLNRVEMYNPAVLPLGVSDSWTTMSPMLSTHEGLAVAVLGGTLYALGGHTTGGGAVATVEAYNVSSNTWTFKTSMPTARAALAAAVIGNILYAVGGGENAAPLDTLEAYDPASNSWMTLAPMPTPRRGLAAAAVNGLLYAIGGNDATSNLATVEAYDPANNTWIAKSPMPTARTLLAVGVIDGLIYAVGGIGGGALGTVEAYNPATDTWTTLGSMPTPRHELAVGALDGRIFAVGGLDSGDPLTSVSTHEAFRPPETTWWSTNATVATIGQNATANALSAGTSTISARSVGIGCSVCATLTVEPPVGLSVAANQASFSSGENLTVSVDVDNAGASRSVDFYFGALLPDGDTIVFFTDLSFNVGVGGLSNVATLSPIAAGVDLSAPFSLSQPSFFNYTWTGGEPGGSYVLFLAAVVPGAFTDGRVDPGDLLGLSTAVFAFAP